MRKIFRSIVAVLAVLVLNGFGFVGHTAAMPMHGMNDMSHEQTTGASCATLCRTAVVNESEQRKTATEEDEDDEPYIPFYLQLQSTRIDSIDTQSVTCKLTVKPPPKVPIYILHCVSRS